MRRVTRGFTLVELLITVLIVAILASIAVPSYRQHVITVRRTDAKTALSSMAQRLERCFTRYNQFIPTAVDPRCTFAPDTTPDGTYQITPAIAAQTFTLTATPLGAQADDTRCGTLSVTNRGVQGATGTSGVAYCW